MKQINYQDDTQYWPRKSSVRILKLKTREDMLTAIEDVPEIFQSWVKFYLNDWIRKAGSLANLKNQFERQRLKRERKY